MEELPVSSHSIQFAPYGPAVCRNAYPAALLAVVFALCGDAAMPTMAEEEFRVETRVYVGGEAEVKAENLTIFAQGWVYDFLDKPAEITILNKSRTKFHLIDPSRRIRTEVTTEAVKASIIEIKERGGAKNDPFAKFLVDPRFDERVEASSNRRIFESPWIVYRVAAKRSEDEDRLGQFYDFSDWFTKLNVCLNPQYRQVFVRLAVNESLRSHGELPYEVELSYLGPKGKSQKITARSVHKYSKGLDQSDRDRVEQADQFLEILPAVKLAEYRKKRD
jgi:hypothetical protein